MCKIQGNDVNIRLSAQVGENFHVGWSGGNDVELPQGVIVCGELLGFGDIFHRNGEARELA